MLGSRYGVYPHLSGYVDVNELTHAIYYSIFLKHCQESRILARFS
jgi:hypothetical protein